MEVGRTLPEFQQFHRWLDQAKGFDQDLFSNTVLLTTEVGELAKEIVRLDFYGKTYQGEDKAEKLALIRENLGAELADCLAYLLKLANITGVDLESAYLAKMERNRQRAWPTRANPGAGQ